MSLGILFKRIGTHAVYTKYVLLVNWREKFNKKERVLYINISIGIRVWTSLIVQPIRGLI